MVDGQSLFIFWETDVCQMSYTIFGKVSLLSLLHRACLALDVKWILSLRESIPLSRRHILGLPDSLCLIYEVNWLLIFCSCCALGLGGPDKMICDVGYASSAPSMRLSMSLYICAGDLPSFRSTSRAWIKTHLPSMAVGDLVLITSSMALILAPPSVVPEAVYPLFLRIPARPRALLFPINSTFELHDGLKPIYARILVVLSCPMARAVSDILVFFCDSVTFLIWS